MCSKTIQEFFSGLPKLNSTSEDNDPIAKRKLISPVLDWEWYLIEGEEEEECFFGYVKGYFDEFGSITVRDLEEVQAYEDKSFEECPISIIINT